MVSKVEAYADELRSPEGYLYAGLPKFRRLFGRDSIISSLELLNRFPEIARSTLQKLSDLQGREFISDTGEERGKILHEHMDTPSESDLEHMKRVPWLKSGSTNYFSVDSTPLFLILAAEYCRKTGNTQFISSISRNIADAARWILDYGISSGSLVYFKPREGQGLRSQSWRDGIGSILEIAKDPVAVTGVQGYLIEAIDSLEYLEGRISLDLQEDALKEARRDALDSLMNVFYDEDAGYFPLAVDGDGVASRHITSDPGHLLACSALPRKVYDSVVSRLMEPDMLTDYGIRCLSSRDPNFDDRAYQRGSVWPHDNWMIARGLRKLGYRKEYSRLRDAVLRAHEETGSAPEYYGVRKNGDLIPARRMRVRACDPQAWTAGAILDFQA